MSKLNWNRPVHKLSRNAAREYNKESNVDPIRRLTEAEAKAIRLANRMKK